MRIGLNAITLYPGAIGGMETYFRKLLYWMQQIESSNRYTVIYNEGYRHDMPLQNSRFSMQCYRYERKSFNWYVRGMLRNTLNIDPVRSKFRKLGLDLIHHPFNVLNPIASGVPAVLTIHDIQHEYYPHFFAPGDLRKRKALFKPSADEAARIICISDFTRRCILEKYGLDEAKIDVIPVGCGEEYQPLSDVEGLTAVRQKYGLDRPFLYYPAGSWPHKNHRTLLKAFKILQDQGSFDGTLVLTGVTMRAHSELIELIQNLGLGEKVKVLGYLAYEELPYLYNLARLLVFPSLFEGFGIPVLEAMACGCPVVCSNAASLPEVAGEAGLLFDPTSAEELAELIGQLWENEARQQAMRQAGLERVKFFSWQKIAQRTAQTYESALR